MRRRLSAMLCALGALAFSAVFLAACDSDGGDGSGGSGSGLGGGLSKLFKGSSGSGGGGTGGDDGGTGGDDGGTGGDDGGTGGDDGGTGGGSGGGDASCSGVCGHIWQCMEQECPPFGQADAATRSEFQSECASACSAESPSSAELGTIYDYSCADLWSAILAEMDSGDRSELEQACSGARGNCVEAGCPEGYVCDESTGDCVFSDGTDGWDDGSTDGWDDGGWDDGSTDGWDDGGWDDGSTDDWGDGGF